MKEALVLFRNNTGYFIKISTFEKGFLMTKEEVYEIFDDTIYRNHIRNSKNRVLVFTNSEFDFTKFFISKKYAYDSENFYLLQ